MIIPTLRVGMHPLTLRVIPTTDAERPESRYHQSVGTSTERSYS
jgi:hypothetical protein